MLLSPRSWLLKGEGRLLGWANPSPLQGFLAFGHGCSKLVSFCIGLTSGSNKSPLGAPMLVAQGGPKAQGSQDMAPPSGDSRFSSSVATTSTSSGSIWQASARAWPVAMTKLASAAKESSPPRTRASWISMAVAGAVHLGAESLGTSSSKFLLLGVSRDHDVGPFPSSCRGCSVWESWHGKGGTWPSGILLWVICLFSLSTWDLL